MPLTLNGGETVQRKAILIGGMMWGDEDKGATTDWLARELLLHDQELTAVFRTTGGSQPAHTVITDDGKKHIFRQVTSASFVPKVLSYLSKYVLIDPIYLLREMMSLQQIGISDIGSRIRVDRQARIITPLQVAANRLRERSRGENRHGTCGRGIGETQDDFAKYGSNFILTVGELSDKKTVRKKLNRLLEAKYADLAEVIKEFRNDPEAADEIETFTDPSHLAEYGDLYDALADYVTVVDENWVKALLDRPGFIAFENTQGALLDVEYGFTPYVTKTKTTFANADALLDEYGYEGQRIRLGLTRSYAHRHGAGPLPSFDASLTELLPDPNNPFNPWQQHFRAGYFDPIALAYALEMVGGVDFLVVGHLDQLEKIPEWKIADSYQIPRELASGIAAANNGEKVTALRFKSQFDPQYQARLTQALELATLTYTTLDKQGGIAKFLEFLETRFGIPIGLTAFGPTASDRVPSDALQALLR